ncbi:rho GTPase-activating protein 32 [Caerostris extrusa]|uniref:Rho GTPase-activating protein 32 n=1 Tax=Caerostris extrusa TaxID=172846 RepID=A0AAV4TWS0_CAEEX|nr:rho GTPase-activating protein 32 [Caerostris extrusa]
MSVMRQKKYYDKIRNLLSEYLERFSQLAGSLISCGPVLNWFELDNRGNRLIVTDEAINTPAVAASYVVVPYSAQATDEISFDVSLN